MKILITVTTDIIFDQRIRRIASGLTNHGHQVIVYGRTKGIKHQITTSFESRLIPCWFSKSFLFYVEYNLRLFFILLLSRCDIICACDLDTLLGATMASVLRNKKLVFDAHEYFEESIEIIHKPQIQKIWEWIARICLPFTRLRYTVSKTLAKELSVKYGKEFKVIRNVPLSSDPIVKETRQNIIWYQGAINEGRGLECMIDCMVTLTNYSFYLAGDGDKRIELQKKRSLLGLENRVRFLGKLNNPEMAEYASFAFVGIDLLESSSKSYYFSLSNKTFDYMHTGLPSIQMNFPEYQEMHREFNTGVLIDKVDKESILDAIHQLEKSEYYEQCILACKEASKVFKWEEEEKLLIEMYEKIN